MMRVLLVDDERLALDRLRVGLRGVPGVEVAGVATDGIEALDQIEELRPDLVLLDIQMPGRTGMDVAKALLEHEAIADVRDAPALRPGRYVRIVAVDTGTGMDQATLARAVEPFFSTKGIGKGTGLGLSMIHGLAAQSGGTLRIASAPGQGTTVELWLPVSNEAGELVERRRGQPAAARRAATVLLVDDEEIVRTMTADLLRDLGYAVVEAASGAQALSMLRSGVEADVVVTDYLMPGMTGAALIEELRREGSRLPLLLITGYANTGDDVPPDVPRLSKPFRQVDLAARVDELVRVREWTSDRPQLRTVG